MIQSSLGTALIKDKNGRIITDKDGNHILASMSNWELITATGNRSIRARFKIGSRCFLAT